MAGSQILRDMGNNWLECQDNLGIFYFNQLTQQSSDTVPAELAGGQPGTSVLRELAGSWLECQDAQGIFYFNQVTQQSSDTMPAELMVAAPYPGIAVAPTVVTAPAVVTAPVAAAGDSTILRELPNNWLECLDAQGIFYFHKLTQQSSDTMPAELMAPVAAAPLVAPVQAAPLVTPMEARALGQRPPVQAKVIGGGISGGQGQTYTASTIAPASYAPVAAPASYAPIAVAPASYAPAAPVATSYAPGAQVISAPQGLTQVGAAPPSYTPLQVSQAPTAIAQPTVQVSQAPTAIAQPTVQYSQAPTAIAQTPVQYSQAPTAIAQPKLEPQVMYQQPPPSITTLPPGANQLMQVQVPWANLKPKSAFGDWAVYEDHTGEYFVQVSTSQRFDTPTQELIQAYKAHKEAGLVVPA